MSVFVVSIILVPMSKATGKKKLKELKQAITNEQNYPWTVNSVLTDKPGSRYSAMQRVLNDSKVHK